MIFLVPGETHESIDSSLTLFKYQILPLQYRENEYSIKHLKKHKKLLKLVLIILIIEA
jgi:hypothetical protein